jgi:hypothetical protein
MAEKFEIVVGTFLCVSWLVVMYAIICVFCWFYFAAVGSAAKYDIVSL